MGADSGMEPELSILGRSQEHLTLNISAWLAREMVPYQQPVTLITEQMTLQTQVFSHPSQLNMTLHNSTSTSTSSDTSGTSVSEASFSILAAGSLDLAGHVIGSMVRIKDDVFTGGSGSVDSDSVAMASPLLSLTLMDADTGLPIAFTDGTALYPVIYMTCFKHAYIPQFV